MSVERLHIETIGPRTAHPLPEDRCALTGKRRFGSEGSALAHAERWASQASFKVVRAYPCRGCGGWHLTKMALRERGRRA